MVCLLPLGSSSCSSSSSPKMIGTNIGASISISRAPGAAAALIVNLVVKHIEVVALPEGLQGKKKCSHDGCTSFV